MCSLPEAFVHAGVDRKSVLVGSGLVGEDPGTSDTVRHLEEGEVEAPGWVCEVPSSGQSADSSAHHSHFFSRVCKNNTVFKTINYCETGDEPKL